MLTRHGAWVRLEMRLPESAYPPIGFDAGDGNLRRVVGAFPTNATDPSGLEAWSDREWQIEDPAGNVKAWGSFNDTQWPTKYKKKATWTADDQKDLLAAVTEAQLASKKATAP